MLRQASIKLLLLAALLLLAGSAAASLCCATGTAGERLFSVAGGTSRYLVLQQNGVRVTLPRGSQFAYAAGVPRYRVVDRGDGSFVLSRLPAPSANPVRAINHAAAGATIVVGRGTYRGAVVVPRGVTVIGSGRSKSWLKGPLRFSSDCAISGLRIGRFGVSAVRNHGNVSYTTFADCQFRGGGGRANSGNDNVVTLTGASSHLTFTRCRVERNLGRENAAHGRHFDNVFINPNTNAPSMESILFRSCRFGVSNGRARGGPRFNVEIWTDPRPALRTGGFSDIDFERCTFEATADANIDYSGATLSSDNLTPSNGPCHVTGCTFKGNGAGSYRWVNDITAEEGAGYLTITGNTFYRGQGRSFYAENQRTHSPGSCYGYNTFSNNVIDATNRVLNTRIVHAAAWEYVRLDSQYNVVSGNRITNTSKYRQCVGIFGSHNTVQGNRLANGRAGHYTVGLHDRTHGNMVVGNVLVGGGIDDNGTDNTTSPNP